MIPETATTKLALLAQAASDAQALAMAAKKQSGDAENRARLLINNKASVVDITKAMATVEAAQDLMLARRRVWEEREQLVTRVQTWLRELPSGVTLEPVPAASISTNGTTPAVALAAIRGEIAKLATEHHAVRTADAPLADAKQQARELVARLGATGRPTIHTQFGKLQVHGWTSAEQFGPTFHDKTVATLCWLMPDTVIAKLDEALEALPGNLSSVDKLPLSERAAKLAEIEAEIALLEDREEVVIGRAADEGVVIERRPEQSPASILGVRIAKPASVRVVA